MHRVWLLILALALLPCIQAASIQEVMYNPEGDDNNAEYVEIQGTDNLTGFLIGDTDSNDTLTLMHYMPGNLSLITEDGYNGTGLHASWYSAGKTIGNGLQNDQDTIFLFQNDSLISTVTYDGTLANGNGLSLSLINGTWQEALPTPGLPNIINTPANATNGSLVNETPINQTNQTGNNGTATNLTNTTACNTTFSLSTAGQQFTAGDHITFTFSLDPEPDSYRITYWVEDLGSKVVKAAHTTTNLDAKSFTPNIKEQDQAFLIKGVLSNSTCNASGDDQAERLVVVYDPSFAKETPEPCPKTDCPACSCQEATRPTGSIEKLYTRQVHYTDSVNIYANIKGEGSYTLKLAALNTTTNMSAVINTSNTLKANLSIRPIPQTILASLYAQGELLDVQTLFLSPEIKDLESVDCPNVTPTGFAQQESSAPVLSPQSTGNTVQQEVYASSGQEVTKYIKWVIVFLGVVLLGWGLRKHIHGRKANQSQDRAGLDPRKGHLRNRRQPQRTHRQESREICLDAQAE